MKRSWLIAGAVVGCITGAAVGACGSGNGSGGAGASGVTVGATTSGKTTGTGATTTTTTGSPTTTTGAGMGGAGGGACSAPGDLHPPKADAGPNTIYCPFSGVDGGTNDVCDHTSEHCCEYPKGMGQTECDPKATPCGAASNVDWGCQDPVADCAANEDCCAPGASIGINTDPACANFAHTMTSTTCVPKGTCSGIIMCTSDGSTTNPGPMECPASAPTCTKFSKAGAKVGGCM